MSLTTQQVTNVLALIEAGVDTNTYNAVRDALQRNLETCEKASVPYADIRTYSTNLLDLLDNWGTGIVTASPGDELLMVYMNKCSVARILDEVPSGGYVAALPGIEFDVYNNPLLTISLLATNSSKQVLAGHIDGTINGEENWDDRGQMKNLSTLLPVPI